MEVGKYGGDGPETVQLMSHLLGAYEKVHSQYSADEFREFGMQYQWGRKDPFPAHDVRVNTNFYDGNGKSFDFLWEQREMMWIMEKQMLSKREGPFLR